MTRNGVFGRRAVRSRVLGVALLVASALTGVVAAALIARPPWSVPAAILLAAATVGVAAGLMLLRRSDADADRSSPRGGAWSAKRLRRTALVFGVVLVTFAAVTAATLLVPGAALFLEPVRAWSVIVIYGGCGAGLLATGLARIPSPVQSSERPRPDPSADGAEWVRLGRNRGGPDLRTLTAVSSQLQLVQVPLVLVSLLPRERSRQPRSTRRC